MRIIRKKHFNKYLFFMMAALFLSSCKTQNNQRIINAARQGQEDVVKELVLQGMDPDQKDKYGKTALHYLAESSNGELKESTLLFLSGYGVNLDMPDNEGQTPLFYSVLKGNLKAASELIHLGANVNAVNHLGQTAAFKAKTLAMLRLLFLAGADIYATDGEGKNLLHVSVSPAISGWLIQNGVNFKHRDKFGKTPFEYSFDKIRIERDNIVNQFKKEG